jgi:hypothetical protein
VVPSGGGNPAGSGFATQQSGESQDEDRVAKLEQSAFGTTYPEHEVEDRVDHLEKEILGSQGSGNMDDRIAKLESKLGGSGTFGQSSSRGEQPTTIAQLPGGPPHGGAGVTPRNPPPMPPAEHKGKSGSGKNPSHSTEPKPAAPISEDYFASVRKFTGGTVARWRSTPVRIHLPSGSPDSWQRSLEAGVKHWNQYLAVNVVPPTQPADIDVIWENHLVPQYLGVTRLIMPPGQMQVQIYMLRPTYYLPEIPERMLQGAFLHELGHALGIFGHSDSKDDLMYATEIIPGTKGKGSEIRFAALGDRDVKTLKRIYAMQPTPSDFSLEQPLEWGLKVESGHITCDAPMHSKKSH